MEPRLEAILREVEIEAEYRETVYEQTAILQVEDIELNLYDDHQYISKDMVGKRMSFGVRALSAEDGIQVLDDVRSGVFPPSEQISKWSYDFCGEITQKRRRSCDDAKDVLLVDIGLGTIIVSPPKEDVERLEEDSVRVTATRTEVVTTPEFVN